eukprot:CAMPEP_0175128680 /NCGR_PEP_ID=MMETSP0087-20121206/5062_1 /TAXON_ID=136419 /ORGANISM="Unknown Unknown, Strain D1" /LENGTH=150 /DNA_ID=CAMNT_0016410767 /DNA_START=552 /DNA_END=1004 /DNA_ORIENTATION=-
MGRDVCVLPAAAAVVDEGKHLGVHALALLVARAVADTRAVPVAVAYLAELFGKPVPVPVNFVAERPHQQSRVVLVVGHLLLEPVDDSLPLYLACHGVLRSCAQVIGDQRVQAVVRNLVQKEGVVYRRVPAVDPNGVAPNALIIFKSLIQM